MDDLLIEFLSETSEQLDELDAGLVRFEQHPNDDDVLNTIFRVTHTIKGTCGFFELPRLSKLAHAAEALMGHYRDGATVSAQGVTVILASLERFKDILAQIGRDGVEPHGTDDDLIDRLNALADGREEAPLREDVAPSDDDAPDPTSDPSAGPPPQDEFAVLEDAWRREAAESTDEGPPVPRELPDAGPRARQQAKTQGSKDPKSQSAQAEIAPLRSQTVRVTVDTLENLMTSVSELVLARNQLLDVASHADIPAFATPLRRLSTVTFELHEAIMKARMQPISHAWQKLPVLVRTLSVELGKSIDINLLGGDEELDRQVLEAIRDPLTHMVRNAADHGLESPSERAAAGKSAKGRIKLKASQQGGGIVLTVADDGRGLDVERVRRKVLEFGLATQAELEGLSDSEICNYIFKPGFSTTDSVSMISGRGVGMDVVRRNIESIGGTVDLTSTSPAGTVFTVKIPLTLAIMSALIVDVVDMRFAIPQFGVVELVRVGDAAGNPVEFLNGAAVLHLRDKIIPLV
ncbi:MAG: chemotaxis protein CheA, partial [Pseudomonadota bacterium]